VRNSLRYFVTDLAFSSERALSFLWARFRGPIRKTIQLPLGCWQTILPGSRDGKQTTNLVFTFFVVKVHALEAVASAFDRKPGARFLWPPKTTDPYCLRKTKLPLAGSLCFRFYRSVAGALGIFFFKEDPSFRAEGIIPQSAHHREVVNRTHEPPAPLFWDGV